MTVDTWTIIILAASGNIFALVKSYVSFSTRLTNIEADLKWIKGNCKICPPNSDKNSR